MLRQDQTDDTPCNTRAKRRTCHQRMGDINSAKSLGAEKRFEPPTSERHSTEFGKVQDKTPREEVEVIETLKISGHKNQDISFSIIMSSLPSISEKANNGNVQNAFMPETILVNPFFFEECSRLKKDYKSTKHISI